MFSTRSKRQTPLNSAITIMTLVYHSVVRSIRSMHGNAVMSIMVNILQVGIFVSVFYLMFLVLGVRKIAIRGDFVLYLLSGVFVYMTNVRTMAAVAGAGGPSSPIMKHAPMNTIIAILSAAFSALYIQSLSLFVILIGYDVFISPLDILYPVKAYGMLLLSWFFGAAVGLVFLSIKPWFPTFSTIANTFYKRANMVASGKMFVANSLSSTMLAIFDWNPLFHCIDQTRGFVFVNYFPRNSSWQYAFWVSVVLTMIGLMAEFYTRRHASLSWDAKR